MGECIHNQLEFSGSQLVVLETVGQAALALAADRYGTGLPLCTPGSEANLLFNNARHGRMVGSNFVRLGAYMGFDSDDCALGRTIGESHDVVQCKKRGVDERESAEWLEGQLMGTGLFDQEVVRIAGQAILGTEPLFAGGDTVNGKIIGQKAAHMEFRSRREERIVKGVAAADHGEIYTPMGPTLSRGLYQQKRGLQPGESPDMAQFKQDLPHEIAFLETYTYILDEAEVVLATHRTEVIKYAHFLDDALGKGAVGTWGHVEALDRAFLVEPVASLNLLKIAQIG